MERGDLIPGKMGKRTIIRRSEIDRTFEPPKPPSLQEEAQSPSEEFSESEFYTLTEVQQKFGISEKALQEVIKREQIPKVRMAKYAFVPKSRINEIFCNG